MTQTVTAFFTDVGIPAVGLSPTVRIRRLDTDALVVTDAAMVNVGDGFYDYVFTGFDSSLEYVIRADGTSALDGADRFKAGALDGQITQIHSSTAGHVEISADGLTIKLFDDDNNLLRTLNRSTNGKSRTFT